MKKTKQYEVRGTMINPNDFGILIEALSKKNAIDKLNYLYPMLKIESVKKRIK
jgi:hypothetical protein